MSTISTDRVIQGTLSEYLVCQIWLNVLVDPMEWTQWETSYWNKCITDWIRRKKTENPEQELLCPKQCRDFKLKKSHLLVRNQLKNLLIKWGVSSKWMFRDSIDGIIDHERNWDFNAVPWVNMQIWSSLWRRNEVEKHLEVWKILTDLHDKCNLWNNKLIEGFNQINECNPFLKIHQDYFCQRSSFVDWILCDKKSIVKSKYYDHIKNEWRRCKLSNPEALAMNLPKFQVNEDEDYPEWSNEEILKNYEANRRINKSMNVQRRKDNEAKEGLNYDINEHPYFHNKKPEVIFKISSSEDIRKDNNWNEYYPPPYSQLISEFNDNNKGKNDNQIKKKDSYDSNININLLKRDMEEYNSENLGHVNDSLNNTKNLNNASSNQGGQSDIINDYYQYRNNLHISEFSKYQNSSSQAKIFASNPLDSNNKSLSNISNYIPGMNNNNIDMNSRRLSLPVWRSFSQSSALQSCEFEKVYNDNYLQAEQREYLQNSIPINRQSDLRFLNHANSRFSSNDFLFDKRQEKFGNNINQNLYDLNTGAMPNLCKQINQQRSLNNQVKNLFWKNQGEDENDLKPVNYPF